MDSAGNAGKAGDRVSTLLSVAVGDALGVPVEFQSREYLRGKPITGMVGFGSHRQPPGTWSDDTSMTLCGAESLLRGFDLEDMGHRFVRWLDEGYWTAHGRVFDVGGTTGDAIRRLKNGFSPEKSGGASEFDNGNGSLMRILPVAAYFARDPVEEMLDALHKASAITHAHPRSMMACGLYGLVARGLLEEMTPATAYAKACEQGKEAYANGLTANGMAKPAGEIHHFARFLSGDLADAAERSIKSDGYVVHTLEASVWCLLTTDTFCSAVQKAVNLGEDTDTTGAVAAGLAGLYYRQKGIPPAWLDALARRDDIADLESRFQMLI